MRDPVASAIDLLIVTLTAAVTAGTGVASTTAVALLVPTEVVTRTCVATPSPTSSSLYLVLWVSVTDIGMSTSALSTSTSLTGGPTVLSHPRDELLPPICTQICLEHQTALGFPASRSASHWRAVC